MCLNQAKFPLYRNCTSTGWQPERPPQCDYVQNAFEDENSCPFGYVNVTVIPLRSICVLVTEPRPWENVCLQDGSSTVFYELSKDEQIAVLVYLKTHLTGQMVWMPAKRPEAYGSVVWTIAGDLNGETVEFDELGVELVDEANIIENGCFSAQPMKGLKTGYIRRCDEHLPHLCVLPERSRGLIQLACPKDFYSTPYAGHQRHCFSGHRLRKGNTSRPSTPMIPVTDEFWSNDSNTGNEIQGNPQSALTAAPTDKNNLWDFSPQTGSYLNEKEFNWIFDECRGNLYTIDSYQRISIFLDIAKEIGFDRYDNCLFAVKKDNYFVKGQSSWLAIASNVTYVNWDYPLQSGIYLTTRSNGKWNWIQDSFNCILCERELEIRTPELVLNFHEGKGRLYLIIYGEEFLWRRHSDESGVKCFTNSDYELVKTVKVQDKIWSGILATDEIFGTNNISKSKTIYEIKLYGDGPGYYWCQAHAIPDFQLIQASRIVAYRRLKGEVFAVFIDILCNKCEKLFLRNYIKSMAREFRNYLQEMYKKQRKTLDYRVTIENVRVMKIEKIYPKPYLSSNQYAKILFHLTVSSDYNFENDKSQEENALQMPRDQLKIYHMKKIIHTILSASQSKKFIYHSINSTEYCLPASLSIDGALSWTTAKIGEISAPRELCLLSNGLPVLRSCVGDFLYGGIW